MPRKSLATFAIAAILVFSCAALAQTSSQQSSQDHADAAPKPSVFIQAQSGFDSALSAAFIKKQVPANVVTVEDGATYTLKSADVNARGRVAHI